MVRSFHCFLLLLFLFFGCSSKSGYRHSSLQRHSSIQEKKEKKQVKKVWIMIDPGHGGEDFGTRSLTPPRFQEKYLNLATACILKDFLHQMGYCIMMTRQKDIFVSLDQRVSFANCEKPVLFVSVHYNAAPSTKAQGVEVYYFNSKEDKKRASLSKQLAEKVLNGILGKTNAKSRGVKHGDFAVIRETKMPAILVEGGFLSNDDEMNKLKDPVYLKQIALGIATGIDQYLESLTHL